MLRCARHILARSDQFVPSVRLFEAAQILCRAHDRRLPAAHCFERPLGNTKLDWMSPPGFFPLGTDMMVGHGVSSQSGDGHERAIEADRSGPRARHPAR